jgi:hypothetical protein
MESFVEPLGKEGASENRKVGFIKRAVKIKEADLFS